MLNSATGRDGEVVRALKELYKSVLDTLVPLIAGRICGGAGGASDREGYRLRVWLSTEPLS